MPGVLGYAWHESNRGEYLAQFFLSALGVSTPVLRQEDIGADFFCALAREEDKRLTFHSPFMVQHGSDESKEFVYGGYNETKTKWRADAIEWLYSQELPLFVCVTDREQARFRLYATSAMWLLRYNYGRMFQVELKPDAHHDPLRESKKKKVGKNEEGGGFAFEVPLGNPIIDLSIADIKTKREQAIETLRSSIALEQTNITLRRLGVHIAHWPTNVTSNDPASIQAIGSSVFWNAGRGMNVSKQLKSLKDIAVTLALNLNAQGDTGNLAHLSPVFGLFSKNEFDSWILSKLPKQILDILK